MGDLIAPVFLTTTADSQNYHPEIMMTGTGLVDYDVLGQLYNPNVWRHAFGLSHLTNPVPFGSSDAVKAWQDQGRPGLPDKTENLAWAYWSLMGTSFQQAGPRPTPVAIRDGLFRAPVRGGWQESKGDPRYSKIRLGSNPGDYTGIDDAREVWWCGTRNSDINGQPGQYVPVDNGHRYDVGEWPTGDPKVFDSACV